MRAKVVTPHVSSYPNPIQFEPGDRLAVGRRDTENVGWIHVTPSDGNKGWAPERFLTFESE